MFSSLSEILERVKNIQRSYKNDLKKVKKIGVVKMASGIKKSKKDV